ncbi:MAG: zinc ribbon domain-containing protein [Anaerolineae bacterium]|nr:zinc ribbon domain-containing protein [Anaerolineae bacterium]
MPPPTPNTPDNPNKPDRVEKLGTYEMIWDCKFCGAKNLLAKTHKFCPTCGAAQDPQTRRFPSDAEKIAVKEYVSKGASLICAACGTPNDGDSQFCMQCGAPLDRAAQAKTVASEVRAETQAFAAGQERDLAQERLAEDLPKPPAPASKTNPILWIVGAIVLLLICGGVIFALTAKREATGTVTDRDWQRIIYVDRFASVSNNAWDDQVPADAYNVSCRERQRDTRQVPDGEECSVRRVDNGDGTFSERRECNTVYRDEPIYDNYCSFNVNRWVPAREIQASSAQGGASPFWPGANLAAGSALGGERESGRDERYIVYLDVDGRRYECVVNQQSWEAAQEGATFNISIGVITNAPDCSALEQ